MATRATTDIKRRLYQVAQRATTTFSTPAASSDWTTLLGTFTSVGYVRRSSIEGNISRGDSEELDDASELVLGFNLDLKFAALQTGNSEITEFEGLQGDALDIMFYNEDAQRAIVYQNVICNVFDGIKGGETDSFNFEVTKKNAAAVTDIRTHFDIPQS
jgi:hypothetical protein